MCHRCESEYEDCLPPENGRCNSFAERKGPDTVICPYCGNIMTEGVYDDLEGGWIYACSECGTKLYTGRCGSSSFDAYDMSRKLNISGSASYREGKGASKGKIDISVIMPPFYDYDIEFTLDENRRAYLLDYNIKTVHVDTAPSEEEMIEYAAAAFKVAKALRERHSPDVVKAETEMFWDEFANNKSVTSS